MSGPDYEAHYKPPDTVLARNVDGSPVRAAPAGVVRVLLAALAGFLVDVIGTDVPDAVRFVVQALLAPTSSPPSMDFSNWAVSLSNPWTVADLVMGTLMSVFGGWLGAVIARGRAWQMYGVLLVLYFGYSLWRVMSSGTFSTDVPVFLQVLLLNSLAPCIGVLLRLHSRKRRPPDNG